jgi:hypothetical protein
MDLDMARAQDQQDDNNPNWSDTSEYQGLYPPSNAGSVAPSSLGSLVSLAPYRVPIPHLNIVEIAPVS